MRAGEWGPGVRGARSRGYRGNMELLCLDIQLVLQETLENVPHMWLMFLEGPGEDQYVVQVNKDKTVNHITESLENDRSVGQPERHY